MPSSQRVASPIRSLGAFIATFAAEIPAWSLIGSWLEISSDFLFSEDITTWKMNETVL